MKLWISLAAALLPMPAEAQSQAVVLKSDFQVERTKIDAAGRKTVQLEAPKDVVPGDLLVFTLSYENTSAQPATHFALTNPLPEAISLTSVEGGALLSTDGRTFGPLAGMRVRGVGGAVRPAELADVRYVRWVFSDAIAPGGKGTLRFRGRIK